MYLYFVVVVAVAVAVVVVVGCWLLVVGCCLVFVVCCLLFVVAQKRSHHHKQEPPWIKQNPKILCYDNLQHSWCNSPVLHCCPGLVDILVVNCIVGVQDLPVLRAEHKL